MRTCRCPTARGWAASSRTRSTRRTSSPARSRPSSPTTTALFARQTAQRGRRRLQRGEHPRADRQGRRERQPPQRCATTRSWCPTGSRRRAAGAAVPFDVVIWPTVSRHRTGPSGDAGSLLDRRAARRLLAHRRSGAALDGYLAEVGRSSPPTGSPRTSRATSAWLPARGSVLDELLTAGTRQVAATTASVAANLQRLADGSYALHLVNYDYDRSADARPSSAGRAAADPGAEDEGRATAVHSDGRRGPAGARVPRRRAHGATRPARRLLGRGPA